MKHILRKTEAYVNETLGISIRLESWPEKRSLPLFLLQKFEFAQLRILDRPVLAAIATDEQDSPAEVRKQFEQLQLKFDGDLIYIRDQLDAYQRQRLIQQKVSFIVPGNQLYLPTFGLDLREYFRQRKKTRDTLSPLAQLAFIYAIYHPELLPVPLGAMSERLSCSKMSMSRAFTELESFELAASDAPGRFRNLTLADSPMASWESAQAFLRSPVKKRVRVSHEFDKSKDFLIAGQTALARVTNITAGHQTTYAIGPKQAKKMRSELLDYSIPDDESELSITIEIWNYEPGLLSSGPDVDRLSLFLSMKSDQDERIEAALENLLKGMPW